MYIKCRLNFETGIIFQFSLPVPVSVFFFSVFEKSCFRLRSEGISIRTYKKSYRSGEPTRFAVSLFREYIILIDNIYTLLLVAATKNLLSGTTEIIIIYINIYIM